MLDTIDDPVEMWNTFRALLKKEKKRYVRGLAEEVKGHLNANDLRPAYWARKKRYFKSTPWVNSILATDCRLVSDMAWQHAR